LEKDSNVPTVSSEESIQSKGLDNFMRSIGTIGLKESYGLIGPVVYCPRTFTIGGIEEIEVVIGSIGRLLGWELLFGQSKGLDKEVTFL